MTEGKVISDLFDQLLFPHLFRVFRIAVQPGKLLTVFLAVAILFVLGWIMDSSRTVVTSGGLSSKNYSTELYCFLNDRSKTEEFIKEYRDDGNNVGLCSVLWNFCVGQFNDAVINVLRFDFVDALANVSACVSAAVWAFSYHTIYTIIFSMVGLVVFSIAGGAICRSAAIQFARDERPGFIESLRFSIKKFRYFFMTAVTPAAILIFFGVCIFLFGLLFNIPFAGELIVGVTAILLLTVGLMAAIVIVGTVAGGGLMFPVIAYENSDNYDAVSRSFSYVCTRPWRMAAYVIVTAVYGSICYLFVRFVVFLVIAAARQFVTLSIWTDSAKNSGLSKIAVIWPEPEFFNLLGQSAEASRNTTESIAAFLVYVAILIASGVVISFVISFYFSATSVIYALMRKNVDNTSLDSVYVQIEQLQQEKSE